MNILYYLAIMCILAPGKWGYLISLRRHEAGITRLHNFLRCLEKSSNMKLMTWDRYLARRARNWSEKCRWAHQKRGLGENLYYYWSTSPINATEVILKGVNGWWKEKFNWRWSTSCGNACHYTQVVWAKTSKVGCALSKCQYLWTTGSSVRNAYYFVCFYSPPGNYYGQYPYVYGRKCQGCEKSDVCQVGLCSDGKRKQHLKYLPYLSVLDD